jgi:transcriptional regulator with XRE-family HTH domain
MFPERLELLRKEKKLSQQYMGDLLGVTRQAYAKYEKDDSEPDIATINKLASFFAVTTDYLLGNTDKKDGIADQSKISEYNTAFHDFDNITDEEKEYLETQLEIFRKIRGKNTKEHNEEK